MFEFLSFRTPKISCQTDVYISNPIFIDFRSQYYARLTTVRPFVWARIAPPCLWFAICVHGHQPPVSARQHTQLSAHGSTASVPIQQSFSLVASRPRSGS
uniref:(northern house mosquito) hypothetical protein n=1 Tax=Culex pipiens TaxID=7175 RepID=A0A8D8FBA2_CULPI